MKKKINIQFIAVAITAIFLTLILAVAAFYEVFEQEIIDNLKTYTHVLKSSGVFDDSEQYHYSPENKDIRITLIQSDGTVRYDSSVDILDMDNHKNRPEIEEAFTNGEGYIVRRSKTMDKSTFYYAVRLEDGCVLRVSKESGSIISIISGVLPMIIGIVIVMIVGCLALTHMLTKSLVTPIERMAEHINNLQNVKVYKELVPFVNIIQRQHEDIMKNAKMRQEFTANVSHELKTPLTSISGYSELIENGMATDDDVIRFAGEIHKNSKRLLTLINDIIKLSELDVMEQKVEIETVNLYQIANDCVSILQINAENHDVTIKMHGNRGVVLANREMMEELVYNLCDNAIRYNVEGGSVDVVVETDDEDENLVKLIVKDTGIGISKENQERIFERFYRVDKSRSKSTGGTGLGLAIVKHILVQHGAEMILESEQGKGTKITVIFTNV